MRKALFVAITLVLAGGSAFADRSGLVTYAEFLASKNLTIADVKCINAQTENVLNPRNQEWDSDKTVCEVWVNEKITPAQPLTFKDGSQVYMTVRTWMEPEPRQVERSDEYIVRADSKQEQQTTGYKRYVTAQ